ncbi:loganic acid O-methyltransferase-like [Aristolochia californica]|uniref:loganic acid O-methyltransferase-like n=1 Tax=Aristolochia californica TaxID=171875 RepID=UPI0035D5FDA0
MESYGISIESLPTNVDNVKAFESYPMNGGDGPASYAHNSHYQGEGVNAAKKLISEAIDQHSCLKQLSSLKTYHVSDLGCSVGPNTFTVVQNIIDSVKHKLVPNVLTDETSPAWNKGRIMSDGTKREVEEAYAGQFATDMAIFLQARAEEVAVGGLMALTVPYSKGSVSVQQALFTRLFRILDLTLNDMAAKGRLDEAKVNSFNLPLYIPSAQEIQKLVERNGSFSIEKMQPLTSSTKGFNSRLDARQCSLMVRAPMEGIMSQYFGSEAINEIFEVYVEIAEENSEFISQSAALTEDLFVLLKRKA